MGKKLICLWDMSSQHDRARQLAIAQDFGAEALRLNEELVASNPGDLASRTRLGRCYRDAGRAEDAEAQYREVLRLDPKNRIAAGGLVSIDQDRKRALAPPVEEAPARGPRAARRPAVRRVEAGQSTEESPAPLAFTGFQPRDFAELRFCDARDVRLRFAPRVVDLVKRVNALKSSEEIAAVREAGKRQLFRASRSDVHVETAQWSVNNMGGRWEPQFNIGMYADRGKTGDWLRAGIAFHLANDGADSGGTGGVEEVRRQFRRFQEILGSPSRSLFTGWMIKENGLVELGGSGPREDLRQPSQAAEALVGCDADRTGWVFFGKWLTPGQAEDAVILADPVEFVRTIDRVFIGLLPLWRALWTAAAV
jgi:hypothetical protein